MNVLRSTLSRIKHVFYRAVTVNEWMSAYRILSSEEQRELPENGKQYVYEALKVKKGYWAADPFIVQRNGEVHLFFEYTNTRKAKAVIARKRIKPYVEDHETIIYEFPYHTSYPCIFQLNDYYYMVPETSQAHTLELLKCIEWPNKWRKEKNLIEDRNVVDTTFFKNGEIGFFIYESQSEQSAMRKLSFSAFDVENMSLKEETVLCEYKDSGGRPGGNVIHLDDRHIRVVQPKTHFYGEKIEFYEINQPMNREHYRENKIGELLPEQIVVNQKKGKIIGVHTFNRCNEYEVIDLLIQRIDLLRIPKGVLRRLNLFGYGKYESSGKMIFSDKE